MTNAKRLKKMNKQKHKEYEYQFDRFGNPVIRGPMILNSYQRAILRESGFTDKQADEFINTFYW